MRKNRILGRRMKRSHLKISRTSKSNKFSSKFNSTIRDSKILYQSLKTWPPLIVLLRQHYLATQYPDSHTHFCCPWGCSDFGHGDGLNFGQCFSVPQASSLISDMFWRSEMQTYAFQHHPHHGTTLQLLFVWQVLYLVDNFPS
jgi:hypothetical protein